MPISRKSKIIGSITGFLIFAVLGVAFAMTLHTGITGEATIRTAPPATPDPVTARQISASGTNGDALDCRQIGVSGDSGTITFKPVLTRPATGQVGNESCQVTIKVRNTGTTTLNVAQGSGLNAPNGWSVGAISGDAVTSPIAPGQLKTATITVTASPSASAGAFSGDLNFSDGQTP